MPPGVQKNDMPLTACKDMTQINKTGKLRGLPSPGVGQYAAA